MGHYDELDYGYIESDDEWDEDDDWSEWDEYEWGDEECPDCGHGQHWNTRCWETDCTCGEELDDE
jgi:hypothetical protein